MLHAQRHPGCKPFPRNICRATYEYDPGGDRLSRWHCRHRSPLIPWHRFAICAVLIGAGGQAQQSESPNQQERTSQPTAFRATYTTFTNSLHEFAWEAEIDLDKAVRNPADNVIASLRTSGSAPITASVSAQMVISSPIQYTSKSCGDLYHLSCKGGRTHWTPNRLLTLADAAGNPGIMAVASQFFLARPISTCESPIFWRPFSTLFGVSPNLNSLTQPFPHTKQP